MTHYGRAYADPVCDLASLHIEGTGQFLGTRVKLLYVAPLPEFGHGSKLQVGRTLGKCQAVAAYHMAKHPERGVMRNHVHLELRILDGDAYRLEDPEPHLTVITCI